MRSGSDMESDGFESGMPQSLLISRPAALAHYSMSGPDQTRTALRVAAGSGNSRRRRRQSWMTVDLPTHSQPAISAARL
jgi:hypothetical protein